MRIEVNVWICIPIFVVVYLLTKHVLHKLHNLPPTPFPVLPLIGHLYLLKKPLHRSLAELSKRHGPLLYLQLGSRQVLHVSSSLVAEECLSKNDIIFANRPNLLSGKYFGYNYTSLSWAPYGDHWQNLRRISALEILSSSRLEALSYIRLDETRSLLGRLFLAANENPNQILDLRSEFFGLMFNVMTRMMGGKSFYGLANGKSEDGKRFQDIVTATCKVMSEGGIVDMFACVGWLVAGGVGSGYGCGLVG